MEVHHHSHAHGKKNWKAYFWEFLMLFLAVFCGFLAENFREHQVEHRRELQYMKSLTEDLRKDILQTDSILPELSQIVAGFDSVKSDFYSMKNGRPSYSAMRELAAWGIGFPDFIYTDRTIQQLKNAGNMRLIRNLAVADSITQYDAVVRRGLVHQDLLNQIWMPSLMEKTRNIVNKDLLNRLMNCRPGSIEADQILGSILLTNDKNEFIKYANSASDYKFLMGFQLNNVVSYKQKAKGLIAFIKKEYHFE